jgi:hypothetical protein
MGRTRGDAAQYAEKKEKEAMVKVLVVNSPLTWQQLNKGMKKIVGYSLSYGPVRFRCDALVKADKIHRIKVKGERGCKYSFGPKPKPIVEVQQELDIFGESPATAEQAALRSDELVSLVLQEHHQSILRHKNMMERLDGIEKRLKSGLKELDIVVGANNGLIGSMHEKVISLRKELGG